MHKYAFLSTVAFALLSGCSRPSVSTLPYDKMSDRDFVAVAGGVGYTKGELERDVAITEKLLGLAGVRADEMTSRKEPKSFRRSVINGFAAREALLNEAKRRHVELLSADMERFQDRFAAEISGRMPLSFNALLEALGNDATAFRNNLKKDALSAKIEGILKQQIAAALPTPSAADLKQARDEILKANRQIETDNRALFRLATNAWKSVRAGNDFDVVARKLPSLHKGVSYEADYRDTAGRFRDAAAGTLTAPFASAGGLEIVKVSADANGERHIARLFFKPETAKPTPSPDDFANARRDKAINARYAALLKELKNANGCFTCELTSAE